MSPKQIVLLTALIEFPEESKFEDKYSDIPLVWDIFPMEKNYSEKEKDVLVINYWNPISGDKDKVSVEFYLTPEKK